MLTIRRFQPDDPDRMMALQARCLESCHDMHLLPAGFWRSPAFEEGRNIFGAVDGQGALLGYAALYPDYVSDRLDGARILWLGFNVDPHRPDAAAIRDALYDRALARAGEMARQKPDQKLALSVTYFAEGQASIAYFRARGFAPYESCYLLRRDLALPLPDLPAPPGVLVRPWRMETEAEQRAYLAAYDSVLPEDKTWPALQYFMTSPLWAVGTTFAAFDGDRLVGNVAVWYEPDAQRNVERVGKTECVFTLPGWRRRGIASYLLRQSMHYLERRGLAFAELEAVSDNEPALSVYRALGYRIHKDEVSLGLLL